MYDQIDYSEFDNHDEMDLLDEHSQAWANLNEDHPCGWHDHKAIDEIMDDRDFVY